MKLEHNVKNRFKILFVGIGSIAKRHIRNLRSFEENEEFYFEIDSFRRSLGSKISEGIDNEYTDINLIQDNYDIIFITNPTEMHLDTLKAFHDKGKHFFIEKPVVSLSQLNYVYDIKLRKDSLYYVACPLRYNAVIQFIKGNICVNDIYSIRAISSSYLPNWRPGQDYRETYSAHKDLGGGVSIDLIHEWDYLTYLFGWPEKVSSIIGKKSNLEIDSDDCAIYIAEYPGMIAELHLDYFGRKNIRKIEIFTKDDTIIGDIANNSIEYLVSGKMFNFREERDDFQKRELYHFLEMIMEKLPFEDGFHHGIDVLKLTQGIL